MFNPQDAAPVVSVRVRRELLRLRPGELAARTGITRQALHAAETGASVPNTLVALRLARALECRVEDLFRLLVQAMLQGRPAGQKMAAGTRMQLAQVSVHAPSSEAAPWLAFPLSGQAG